MKLTLCVVFFRMGFDYYLAEVEKILTSQPYCNDFLTGFFLIFKFIFILL